MVKIVMSSGHGLHVRGAEGPPPWGLDEVDEARKVVDQVAKHLRQLGAEVTIYHDDISTTQSENLDRIVDFHNSQGPHDLDAAIHFNAFEVTSEPRGCEVLFVSDAAMNIATDVSATIAYVSGLKDRGAKRNEDLYFLNETAETSVLVEVAFVDSEADVALYKENFHIICRSIAEVLAGRDSVAQEEEPERIPMEVIVTDVGRCSWFGGPDDTGVDADEGLAFFYDYLDAPHLFLPEQPPGTTGLARRLDPNKPYVACRWDYEVTPKSMLQDPRLRALVRAPKTGKQAMAWPADWGPAETTNRIADLSPGLMEALGIETDDVIEIIYPAPTIITAVES
jgi:N-acetylmuramoyl-L-alanine amidase